MGDLGEQIVCRQAVDRKFDEVYQPGPRCVSPLRIGLRPVEESSFRWNSRRLSIDFSQVVRATGE
jgi:hypothetical protein